MAKWAQIGYQGKSILAEVKGDTLYLHDGNSFSEHKENGTTVAVADGEFIAH